MTRTILFSLFLSTAVCTAMAQVRKTTKPVAKTVTKPPAPAFKKAPGGLQYKIFPAQAASPLIKTGQIVKFRYTVTLKDSVLYSSYDKVPGYVKISPAGKPAYNLTDILPKLKLGDSAVTIQLVDTLIKMGMQIPPFAKSGDKMITTMRVIKVFTVDSIARADYGVEMERDRPRQMKEQAEQMAQMEKARKAQQDGEDLQLEQSGEMAREFTEVENYLAAKNIKAQRTGKGTYVRIDTLGTGPQAENGKFITVQYAGRRLPSDSAFEASTYTFQLGAGRVIRGWDEGLLLFKQGGSGTLYIPGFLAYGPTPPPGSPFKPFEPLIFDVRIIEVKSQP